MNDNELFAAIRTELLSQFTIQGLADIQVKRSHQPTQQSTTEEKVIVIHRVGNPQVGGGLIYQNNIRAEQRLKRAVFQFSGFSQANPENINSFTASDLVNTASDLIQSYQAIRNLQAQGVNIERITDIRPSYFSNDKDRFESSPSFDLTVNYQHIYENVISEVTEVNLNNFRV